MPLMNQPFHVLTRILVVLGTAAALFPTGAAEDDLQYWHVNTLKGPLGGKWGVTVETESHWRDNASTFSWQKVQLQFDYRATSWLTLSPAFWEVVSLDDSTADDDDWTNEHRPNFNVSALAKVHGWKLRNRFRVSYRMPAGDAPDVFNFRHRLTVEPPWKWTKLEISPYVFDEVWFEEHRTGIYRNWFSAGVDFRVSRRLRAGVFYLLQSTDRATGWAQDHVVGTRLLLDF